MKQEIEKLTLENSKLVEENKDLHGTVEVLQEKTQEMEASLEEKTTYLTRLVHEITTREEKIEVNEQLLIEANKRVCGMFHLFLKWFI